MEKSQVLKDAGINEPTIYKGSANVYTVMATNDKGSELLGLVRLKSEMAESANKMGLHGVTFYILGIEMVMGFFADDKVVQNLKVGLEYMPSSRLQVDEIKRPVQRFRVTFVPITISPCLQADFLAEFDKRDLGPKLEKLWNDKVQELGFKEVIPIKTAILAAMTGLNPEKPEISQDDPVYCAEPGTTVKPMVAKKVEKKYDDDDFGDDQE